MLKNYIKVAWRNLLKQKYAAIINVSGLSLGMAAAVLVLLWVQNELNFDNYHPHADNIYFVNVGQKSGQLRIGAAPFLLSETAGRQVSGIVETTHFTSVAAMYHTPIIRIKEDLFKEKALAYVDKNYFRIFHYDLVDGDLDNFNRNLYSVILTASLAKKYFGKTTAVGQIIHIDSSNYQVQAVVKDNPPNSSFQFSSFLPMEVLLKDPSMRAEGWRSFLCQTFIRTRENTDVTKVQQQISEILRHHFTFSFNNNGSTDTLAAFLIPLKKLHFDLAYQFNGGNKDAVIIFSILGLLLLFIASINYVNLSTAKASTRSKEVSIKKIMGAGRNSLFAQFMTESLLTSMVALLLTLVIMQVSLPWFNSLTEKTFSLSLDSAAVWQVLLGTLIITIVLTGIYPALLLSSFKPLQILRGDNVLKIKDSALRKILVTAQFTIAIALSICTIVILRQLHFIQNNNEGYNRSQIFSFTIPNSWASSGYAIDNTETIKTIKTELAKEAAIDNVSVADASIQNIRMSIEGVIDWSGKQPNQHPSVSLLSVDADFKKIFKLQLLQGRWYDANNSADRHNYIVTETTVAALGLKKPYIGQFFSVMGDTGMIIGIVKDFHYMSYHTKINAAILMSKPNMTGTFFIQSTGPAMKRALAGAEAAWKKFFPEQPFEYKFMDAEFEQMYRADNKTAKLISIFAGIAIFISCLGLFGLVSFTTEQRTKEIGIRKILGATVSNIATLLSTDFVKLVVLAIVVASPVAWWAMNKWLEAFAYRIALSWKMFAVAAVAAVLIAFLTVSLQTIKAALANPVKSLRTE